MKVLISDNLSEVGVKVFEEAPGFGVDVKVGLSEDELVEVIGGYEGMVVRSATKVSSRVIDAAGRLKVIGRAGVGLDNIDVEAASRRGVVVMNVPGGNSLSAAEHAIALMMALSRNIAQADATMKEGKWEKKRFQGRELCGKTLGIIGAGRIGRIVADRAKGLRMGVVVYDPYINVEVLERMGFEPVSLDELLRRSDYVSIHVPKSDETVGMIGEEEMRKMKRGAMLINCARGGIVDEDALYRVLREGHLGGAALDVFSTEPPGKIPLMELPNFICTPHLGASTREAQENVARQIAEQMVDYLLHGTVKNAVNMPSISSELLNVLRPYAMLAEKIGMFHSQLVETPIEGGQITYKGTITSYDLSPITTALLKGLLSKVVGEEVNFVNAPLIAKDRGIEVMESKTERSEDFASLISVKVKASEGENIISGTIFGKTMSRLLRINNFYLEAVPEGHMLLIHNEDIPGVIGKIGSVLGKHNVNIQRMHVGQEREKRQNVILLSTNVSVQEELLNELKGMPHIFSARKIEL